MEILNSTQKYAKAENVEIQLLSHKDVLTIMIEDDGVGYRENKSEKNSIWDWNEKYQIPYWLLKWSSADRPE